MEPTAPDAGGGAATAASPARGRWSALRRLTTSSFGREVAGTVLARGTAFVLGAVASVSIARLLGPDGRGEYAMAAVITNAGVQVASLGLRAANTYRVSREPALLHPLVANSLAVAAGVGGGGAAAVLALLALRPSLAPVHGAALALALGAIPFLLAQSFLRSLLFGLREVRAASASDVAAAALWVAVIGLLAVLDAASVTSLLTGALAVAVVSSAWLVGYLRPRATPWVPPSPPLLGASLRYGARPYVAGVLLYLGARVDVLILGAMLGAEQTGYLAAATSVASLTGILPLAAAAILFPRLAAASDDARRWQLTRRVLAVVTLAIALVSVLTVLLAPQLVGLLFGAAFLPAVAPLRWLMLGSVFLAAHPILLNHFAASGMPAVTVLAPAAALAVSVVGTIALAPQHGPTGAAIASAAAGAVLVGLSGIHLATDRARRRA